MRASSRRTHRSVTPIFSAACRCVINPSSALFSHSSQSRSSWLIVIRSIPPASRLSRGTFYFAHIGTSHIAATKGKLRSTFQSKDDPEIDFRFQYKMILKI
jgi:hypothetical protein